MDAAFYVLLSVTQYIFLFKKDVLCVKTVVQLFLRFCLNIRRLKYKCYRCFHGKPALEMPRYVKTQIFLILKSALLEVKLLELLRLQRETRNLTNLTKSGICRHLRYNENLIRNPFAIYLFIITIRLEVPFVVFLCNVTMGNENF